MRKASGVFGTSFQRGCELLQLNRSSFHYRSRPKPDDRALRIRIKEIAAVLVRYGYLRITEMLKREGWQVGRKRFRIFTVVDRQTFGATACAAGGARR